MTSRGCDLLELDSFTFYWPSISFLFQSVKIMAVTGRLDFCRCLGERGLIPEQRLVIEPR